MMKQTLTLLVMATTMACDADLAIVSVETPPSACPGEDLGPASSLEIVNAGGTDVDTTINIAWYLSNDDQLDAGDRLLIGGRDQLAGLASGEVASVSINVNQIPDDADLGPQFLLVVVDELDVVSESDEENNVAALPLTVTACDSGCTGSVPPSEADERVEAVAVGPSGEVYVAGTRARVVGFASDNVDGFLRRMDPSASTVAWEAVIDHCFWDSIWGLGVSSNGDPVVSGATRTGPFGSTETDIVIRKYAPHGGLLWEVSPSTPGVTDLAPALAIDPSNDDVVVTGSTTSDGQPFSTLIGRVSTDGEIQFISNIDPIPASLGRAVAVGAGGEIALVGDSGGGGDAYVASLTPEGSLVWTQTFGDSTADENRAIGVARSSAGSIYAVAESLSRVTDTSTRLPQVARFEATGGAPSWQSTINVPTAAGFNPVGGLVWAGGSIFVAGHAPTPRGSATTRPWLAQLDEMGALLSTRVLMPNVHEVTGLALDPAETTAFLSAQVASSGAGGLQTLVVVEPLLAASATAGAAPR